MSFAWLLAWTAEMDIFLLKKAITSKNLLQKREENVC